MNILIYFYLYSIFLLLCYSGLNKVLLNKSPHYRLLTKNRQLYVLKNLIKSASLFYLTIFKLKFVKHMVLSKPLNDNEINIYCTNYVVNDFLGLILCYKYLPRNTKFHHIATMLLYIYLIRVGFNESLIARLSLTYGAFSSISFMVNFYLGIRFVIKNPNTLNNIRLASIVSYIITITLNLTSHTYIILSNPFHYGVLLYLTVLIPIVNDDIVLMKWLMIKH